MINAKTIADIISVSENDPGFTVRMVRIYKEKGLIPSALGRGRDAYTPEHLQIVREVRRLRREEHLSYAEIKERNLKIPGNYGSSDNVVSQNSFLASAVSPLLLSSAQSYKGLNVDSPSYVAQALHSQQKSSRTVKFRLGDSSGIKMQFPPEASDQLIETVYNAVQDALETNEGLNPTIQK
jgi:hypothetical protein